MTVRASFSVFVVGCCCLLSPVWAEEEPVAYTYEKDVLPLVETYCMNCHNGEDLEGNLDLERFASTEMVLDALAVWQRAAMRIEKGEMPPGNRPKPTDEEKAVIAAWIGSLKLDADDCDRIASEASQKWFPGYVMSRRLNRSEYGRTMRDLLGVDLDFEGMLPADGAGGEGFDTAGDALYLSAIQVEKYVRAADMGVEAAFVDGVAVSPRLARTLALPGKVYLTARGEERGAVRGFVERAWRRPVSAAELDDFMALYDAERARGDSPAEALKFVMKAALVSPNFLFLAEPEPAAKGVYALGDFPLASRVSYFLWGTMPDAQLFDAARRGALQDDDVLRYHVQRMLMDEKAGALGELFAGQWLGITQLGETLRLDSERFPEFDAAMASTMRREAAEFFAYIVREDRSLLELIESDYAFVNAELAAIYGLDGGQYLGADLKRVPLRDSSRGGVLGMAAVLAATSHPLRTSPVLRGKWVLENLLGDRVPPPPPEVEQLPAEAEQPDGLTLRARLEAHREKAECASCHATMDPIGFGLENFDPIGRWREEQAGQPIDSVGTLPSGETFDGPAELKAILLKQKQKFARHLSRKVLGYALGRRLTRFDECVIEDCVEALEAEGYRAGAMFETIVLSYPFRHRYSGGTSE